MSVPSRMIAIAIRAPGGPEMLVPEDRPVPALAQGEVMVRVIAAGVNRPDVVQRMGHYPPPKGATDIPGLEIAGEVVDRKSTRLNSSHANISYAVFCLKKKNTVRETV